MPSFYDLLKYAKTGIASAEMTGYDKMRARAAFGGYPVTTITGTPPISFKSDGKPPTALTIAGNSRQDGTPTFCGDRTRNLFDKDSSLIQAGAQFLSDGSIEANSNYSIWTMGVGNLEAGHDYAISLERTTQSTSICRVIGYKNGQYVGNITVARLDNMPLSFTMNGNWDEIRFSIRNNAPNVMVNLGSTALPYEPYGYKIQITCGGQTQTVYLSEPIRKALDGSGAADTLIYPENVLTRRVDSDGNTLATPTTETIELPTITPQRGSNTLTVDTDLQPSQVSITGHIKHV